MPKFWMPFFGSIPTIKYYPYLMIIEMGSFCKSLKVEKTIAYVFNNVLLN